MLDITCEPKAAERNAPKTAAQRHAAAAKAMRLAVRQLQDAVRKEDGLEWAMAIAELEREATHIADRLDAYAKF